MKIILLDAIVLVRGTGMAAKKSDGKSKVSKNNVPKNKVSKKKKHSQPESNENLFGIKDDEFLELVGGKEPLELDKKKFGF